MKARSTRGSRAAPGGSGRVNVETALRWPVGECFLSEDWHEQGARVFVDELRRHSQPSTGDAVPWTYGKVEAALRGLEA